MMSQFKNMTLLVQKQQKYHYSLSKIKQSQ